MTLDMSKFVYHRFDLSFVNCNYGKCHQFHYFILDKDQPLID